MKVFQHFFWVCLTLLSMLPRGAGAETLTVFAAASLKEALDELAIDFRAANGTEVRLVYAGSADLARQIEQGAPADLVLTADEQWMDYLDQQQLLAPAQRLDLLGNRLVVIAPNTGVGESLQLTDAEAWQEWLGEGRLALAEVHSVPAGRYAKDALQSLKVWDKLETRTVQTDNVRAALLLVARAEAPLGLVYATDALAEPQVRVVARIDATLHPPIVYPLARLKQSSNPASADQLYAWLRGPVAAEVFQRRGFAVLTP